MEKIEKTIEKSLLITVFSLVSVIGYCEGIPQLNYEGNKNYNVSKQVYSEEPKMYGIDWKKIQNYNYI